MLVVTAEQMRELDRRVMQEYGMPGMTLMDAAGRALADSAEGWAGSLHGKKIALCCGAGNNGGDGWAAARHLLLRGAQPLICSPYPLERLRGDARLHAEICVQLGIEHRLNVEAQHWPDLLAGSHLVVEALLGTGARGAPRTEMTAAIEAINACSAPVICADIPAGVDSNTGCVEDIAVQADCTVCFACPKPGYFLPPGHRYLGTLHLADIGFPWHKIEISSSIRMGALSQGGTFKLWPGKAAHLLEKRARDANKGDYGHVFLLCGSQGMAGAPALAARAAQRAGAGLVTVLTPAGIQPQVAGKLDEQMTIALPETDGAVNLQALPLLYSALQRATLLGLGPGLSTAAAPLVQQVLANPPCPLVVDADALNALAMMPECMADAPRFPVALTPHPGEAARLLGTTVQAVQSDRMGAVRALAKKYHAIVLLKGAHTLIASPSGDVIINAAGNPGMATGGSGDVLTGIACALIARTLAPARHTEKKEFAVEDTLALAAALHGIAGDLAAQTIGETALTAGDIIQYLPAACQTMEENC